VEVLAGLKKLDPANVVQSASGWRSISASTAAHHAESERPGIHALPNQLWGTPGVPRRRRTASFAVETSIAGLRKNLEEPRVCSAEVEFY
jgi:hypothetical protein